MLATRYKTPKEKNATFKTPEAELHFTYRKASLPAEPTSKSADNNG